MFRFDTGKDGYLDLEELKRMMEKLGVPQTHLALKAMIKEVDEDGDDKISFREVRNNNERILQLQPVGMFNFTFYHVDASNIVMTKLNLFQEIHLLLSPVSTNKNV